MLRKCCFLIATLAAVGLAACGFGPNEPMPPDPDMRVATSSADTLSR